MTARPQELPKRFEQSARSQPKNLEEHLRTTARNYLWRKKAGGKATTDAGGEYVIGNLPDLNFRVTAHLDGYQIIGQRTYGATVGDTVDFTAEATGTVIIDVQLPDGSAPESAQIQVSGINGTWKWPRRRRS